VDEETLREMVCATLFIITCRNFLLVQHQRLIGQYLAPGKGPTIVVVAALHGNEPAGVEACRRFLDYLHEVYDAAGQVFCFVGNLEALNRHRRYVDWDLNRLWDADTPPTTPLHEWHELIELKAQIDVCFRDKNPADCLVIDLHTTSGDTPPFAPVTDHPLNKDLLTYCPFPVILGIEEFVTGGMIEYYNRCGIAALGFEGGSHQAPDAVRQHENFLLWAARQIGLLPPSKPRLPIIHVRQWYEIQYVHRIVPEEGFSMLPGFQGFDKINSGQVLARNATGWVYAPVAGLLFMPLYQQQGNEGFYIIKRLSVVKILISSLLSACGFSRILRLLPGIKNHDALPGVMRVTFLADRLFGRRLMRRLGYRRRWLDDQAVHYQKLVE
jgi:succinylglutamate desuccinylase